MAKRPMQLVTFDTETEFYWGMRGGNYQPLTTSEGYTTRWKRDDIVAKAADETGLEVVHVEKNKNKKSASYHNLITAACGKGKKEK